MWLAHIRAAILLGGAAAASDPENVRKSLDRATQALPKRKHVKAGRRGVCDCYYLTV